MKKFCSLFFIIIFSLSCVTDPKIIRKGDVYEADLDGAEQQDVFKSSSLFKKASFIFLEANNNSLFGDIHKIEFYKDKLIILDHQYAVGVYVFDRQGNFLRTIGNVGKGPGEYIRPFDFTINGDIISVLDRDQQKIYNYNLDNGKYLDNVSTYNKIKDERSYHIEFIGDKLYADAYYRNSHRDNNLLRVIDPKNGQTTVGFFNEKYIKGWSHISEIEGNTFYKNEQGSFFVQQFMDTIFNITRDGIKPCLYIKSKNILSEKEIENYTMADPISGFKFNKIFGIKDVFQHKNKIYFSYFEGFGSKHLVYDMKNGISTIYKGSDYSHLVSPELKSYTIPNFGYWTPEGIYYFLSSYQIQSFQQYAKDGMLNPDIENLNKMKTVDENSNPVIIFCEFK